MRYLLLLVLLLGCEEANPFLNIQEEEDAPTEAPEDDGAYDDEDAAEQDSACIGRYDPDCIPQKYRAEGNVWPPGHAAGPATGERAWRVHACDACHGSRGEGGLGPPLAGTPLPDPYLAWVIREGRGLMPAYPEENLDKAEMWGIVTWLRLMRDP